MWFLNLLCSPKDRKLRRASRRLQRAGRQRRTAVKLSLEALEERWLPDAATPPPASPPPPPPSFAAAAYTLF
jgi:hypothetical protein